MLSALVLSVFRNANDELFVFVGSPKIENVTVTSNIPLQNGFVRKLEIDGKPLKEWLAGIGPSIRTSLLKTLGSARRVRESSVAELASVPKVTPKLAQRIFDHFHPTSEMEPEPSDDCYNDQSQPGSRGGDGT